MSDVAEITYTSSYVQLTTNDQLIPGPRLHKTLGAADLLLATTIGPSTMSSLPPETIAFAQKMFDHARTGDLAALAPALEQGLPANLTNSKGDTLIMLAAYHGHAELVTKLASHGADANRLNDRGQSPLAGAIFKNELSVIKALLAAGADPDAGAPTAREAAKMFKHEEVLDLFGPSKAQEPMETPSAQSA